MKRQAFTLVELAIVLVIIGLIVGGVLVGRDLIRQAELQSIVTDEQKYVTATQTFRLKYKGLPGDIQNATEFWPAADGSTGNTVACLTASPDNTATCNGNGDGLINPITTSNEKFRYWQQLANAKLIAGSYNGIAVAPNDWGTDATNAPKGRISSSFWYIRYWAPLTGQVYLFDGDYGNLFEFGSIPGASSDPFGPLLLPGEMSSIDSKVDDGKPATGKVVIRNQTNINLCTSATSSADLNASYLSTSTSRTCTPIFRYVF